MVVFDSCSEYERVLKSKDMGYKEKMANQYYESEKWTKANTLLQEVLQYSRTSANYEKTYYRYARSFYEMDRFWDAALYFNNFATNFPNSDSTEQAKYLAAKCFDLQAPRYSLDQADTRRAIDGYSAFKMTYPESPYIDEVNKSIQKLFERLEKKDYESAKLYYKIEQYRAAAVYFKEMIVKYPNSSRLESYKVENIESQIKYAENSNSDKKKERYMAAIDDIDNFLYNHHQSDYENKLMELKEEAQTQINQLDNGQSK